MYFVSLNYFIFTWEEIDTRGVSQVSISKNIDDGISFDLLYCRNVWLVVLDTTNVSIL